MTCHSRIAEARGADFKAPAARSVAGMSAEGWRRSDCAQRGQSGGTVPIAIPINNLAEVRDDGLEGRSRGSRPKRSGEKC